MVSLPPSMTHRLWQRVRHLNFQTSTVFSPSHGEEERRRLQFAIEVLPSCALHFLMQFEVNLPPRLDIWALRTSGLEVDDFLEIRCDSKYILGQMPPPTNLPLPYYLSEKPVFVRVSLLSSDRQKSRVRLEVEDSQIGTAIRKHLNHYSVENDGAGIADREHKELWRKINAVLATGEASYEKLQTGEAELTWPLMEKLIQLCKETARISRHDIRSLFAYAARRDHEFAVRWLLKEYESEPDPDDRGDLSLRIWEIAVPAVGDEIIRLTTSARPGPDCGLVMALAKIKHPRAAETIASVIHRKDMAWSSIQALVKLKASQYASLIQEFLRDPDSDVRREAKKALKKFGVGDIPTPPPAKHLIKQRAIPSSLEEWSSNLDMDDVEPLLRKIAGLVDSGFGKSEIEEVIGVVEEMKPDQTRAFRFGVRFQKQKTALYVVLFMDDIDAPDLAIHSAPALIQDLSLQASRERD
jgi:hypothetical protein